MLRKALFSLMLLVGLASAAQAQLIGLRVCEADGVPCSGGITRLVVSNGTLTVSGSTATVVTGGGGGSGTVTSVAMTVPTGFSISGSPVTTSGTLAVSFASGQTASRILATDTSSSALALRQIDTTYVGASFLTGAGPRFATAASVPADGCATWVSGQIGTTGAACGGSGSTGADPTATIGLTAVNGSAGTFLRSDGAPALSQSIAPTWTGIHIWGSGLARMTSPRVTTGILDANGNSMLAFIPTASAVNHFQFTNTATTGGATAFINTLEVVGSDTNGSIFIKTKGADVTNGGQIFTNPSWRYDRPQFALTGSPTQGFGFKSGGSWFSINAANIKLGAGDGGTGIINMSGGNRLVWHDTLSASEDCPPCGGVGFIRAAGRVVGVIGAGASPDDSFPAGATFGFTANTPAQITANVDNYDPGQPSFFQRWSADASRNVTGMTFAINTSSTGLLATKVSGQMHRIWNVGSFNIVLVHDATSTAANRFLNSTGANITIAPNECADTQYDATQSRWLTTPCAAAGAGSGTVTSIATASPITGGTITTTGTIACATCVTSAAALTSNAIVIGGGLQATSTTTTGTGVLTALGVNVSSAGAFVVNGGVLGTPSSGTLTNATGLPPATGIVGWPADASGCLSNNGSGTLSWAACSGGGGGTTINSTDTVIPYRSNSTTFADSPLSVVSGRLTSTATATSSGVVPYARFITPADTAQTADAEFPGIVFGGDSSGATVTRQTADGTTITTQREFTFIRPTYSAAGATTITNAATVAISNAPAAGTNMTLTSPYALFVQAGASRFDGQVMTPLGTQAAPGLVIGNAITSTGLWGNGTRIQFSIANSAGPLVNGVGLNFRAADRLCWDSSSDPANTTTDSCFGRNAAGIIEANGTTAIGTTPGNARDLKHRISYLVETGTDPSAAQLTVAGSNAKDTAAVYVKNDKLVIAYNNSGTVTYITIPLDGSTTTWTHSTTAP